MKVVFLDVDGVLINRRSWYVRDRHRRATPDPPCLAALNRILRETGARIVLSSTWRKNSPRRELVNMLREWKVEGKLIGETPDMAGKIRGVYVCKTRGQEIEAWLHGASEVEAFVILDDDGDMAPFLDRLVKTKFDDGLTEADADRAIALLRVPAPRRSRESVNTFDIVV